MKSYMLYFESYIYNVNFLLLYLSVEWNDM